MILEGIVTTIDAEGAPHLAPMGPTVEPDMRHFVLRPFQTASTFANLRAHGEGVFHTTDDVELLAQAAVGRIATMPTMHAAEAVRGFILDNACNWYAFRVRSIDDRQPRAIIHADVVDQGRQRDFLGFNRARHAVVEAAILATRVHLHTPEELLQEMARLKVWVGKTGGPAEQRAFSFLSAFIDESIIAGSWGLGRE